MNTALVNKQPFEHVGGNVGMSTGTAVSATTTALNVKSNTNTNINANGLCVCQGICICRRHQQQQQQQQQQQPKQHQSAQKPLLLKPNKVNLLSSAVALEQKRVSNMNVNKRPPESGGGLRKNLAATGAVTSVIGQTALSKKPKQSFDRQSIA